MLSKYPHQTEMKTYTIRHTQADEVPALMAMYEHSRGIMRSNGNENQWVNGYPSAEVLADDIRRGVSYVVTDDDKAVGTFAFIIGRDPTYENIEGGSWEDDARPYGTVHRLACAPGRHGIFEACIDWCRSQATSLRIDTHADNGIMLHLIEKHGFDYRGVIHIADGTPRQAYQMLNTRMLCQPMVKYIDQEILPRYTDFDSAHRRDHAEKVIENSMALARRRDADLNMAYAIAAYHDLGLIDGRERHHIVSAQILLRDNNLHRWFSPTQLSLMADAVEDHRASKSDAPRSLYGMIVAEADRDIEPMKILRRTVQYGLSHYPDLDKEQQWQRYVEHLNEKYAEGGYLRLWLPESENAKQLAMLRQIIADRKRLRDLFEKMFDEESVSS